MNDVLKLIFILLTVIGILILFSYNYELKKFISKIKLRNYVKLSKKDEFNLYTFLETKYENILLPKEIIFIENKDYFICNSLKIMSNNQIVNLKIRFKPLKDKHASCVASEGEDNQGCSLSLDVTPSINVEMNIEVDVELFHKSLYKKTFDPMILFQKTFAILLLFGKMI